MTRRMTALVMAFCLMPAALGWSSPPVSSQERDRAIRAALAFEKVATVLDSPRCANCHAAGDAPRQGDDGRPHAMNVRRGGDGRGTPAMRCTNCHQDVSSLTPHGPPGAPDWRLPSLATPMAWKGLSAGDQCRALKDPTRNGNRALADLLEHAAHDRIVVSSWNPGPGRALPPLSHDAFVEQFKLWMDMGAVCPD
jgi:hypothetical protein